MILCIAEEKIRRNQFNQQKGNVSQNTKKKGLLYGESDEIPPRKMWNFPSPMFFVIFVVVINY